MGRDIADLAKEGGAKAVLASFDRAHMRNSAHFHGETLRKEEHIPQDKMLSGLRAAWRNEGPAETVWEEPWCEIPQGRWPEPQEDEKPRFTLKSIGSIKKPRLESFYIVHGLTPMYGVKMIFGPTTVGKTFIATHLLLHAAIGRPYAGRRTEQAFVAY